MLFGALMCSPNWLPLENHQTPRAAPVAGAGSADRIGRDFIDLTRGQVLKRGAAAGRLCGLHIEARRGNFPSGCPGCGSLALFPVYIGRARLRAERAVHDHQ
jgi:hypothetical protein